MERNISGIMRSNLLDKDFELLLKSGQLFDVIDDGFASDEDEQEFDGKKLLLATRLQDFLDCTKVFDNSRLGVRKTINKNWGTTADLLKIVGNNLGRPISHGAMILALDLRGVQFETIEGRKDANMTLSWRSEF